MRPSDKPDWLGDVAQWLAENKDNILTVTLDFNQDKHVQAAAEEQSDHNAKEQKKPQTEEEQQKKKAKKNEEAKKDVFAIPKPVLKQSKLAVATTKFPSPQTTKDEDKFSQWERIRKLDVNQDRFENKQESDVMDMTTFQQKNIVCLAAWYSRPILPDGSVAANKAVCVHLETKNVKKMPAFFPSNRRKFECERSRKEFVQAVFQKLWFRILFQNKSHDETIVHFKDLLAENKSKSHFQTLLSDFINNVCLKMENENDQKLSILFLHEVFAIAMQE